MGDQFNSASSLQKQDEERRGREAGRGDGERGGKEEGEEENFHKSSLVTFGGNGTLESWSTWSDQAKQGDQPRRVRKGANEEWEE